MLDFAHLVDSPGVDVQYFQGSNTTNSTQTWKKPRGCKMVFALAVGGGASGGVGINTATTSGGGAGGGSGAQMSVLLPAIFLPDTLFISCGSGGVPPASITSGYLGAAGGQTLVTISQDSSVVSNDVLLQPLGGLAGAAAATATAGGTAGAAASQSGGTLLTQRGFLTDLGGSPGSGGTTTAGVGTSIGFPGANGSGYGMVCGGAGGGAAGASSFNGSSVISYNVSTGNVLSQSIFPSVIGGLAASGATPAGRGQDGIIVKNYFMNYGGTGGGGASATAGGIAGAGGNGAPGCGGGGAGGSTTTANTLARPGAGGPGFVYIISW